jgi:hypothetical protein
MRDKRTRGPGDRGSDPTDPSSPRDWLDDRMESWTAGAANDNAAHDFADEATTLYERVPELRAKPAKPAAKPARRPSARYRPPQRAAAPSDEPRFGVEGSLPRSLRPGQERSRSWGAVFAGLLVIGMGVMWTMRGSGWSRAMLSLSAYGASVATTRASLGSGHVVEPTPPARPIAMSAVAAPEPQAASPELMEFELSDLPVEARVRSRAKTTAAQRAALRAKRAAKHAAVSKPIEPLVEAEEEYQEPVYYRAAVNEGTLQVNSRPWARVLVDGHFMGHTPQRALRLAAGRHRVLLVNDQLDMMKLFEVTIAAGEVVTRVEILDESAHTSR